jgi:hypothetical protein
MSPIKRERNDNVKMMAKDDFEMSEPCRLLCKDCRDRVIQRARDKRTQMIDDGLIKRKL